MYVDIEISNVYNLNKHFFFFFFLTLSGRTEALMTGTPKVARSRLTQCSKSCDLQPSPHCLVCNTWSSGGTALCMVRDATSQLDLPSLTPLSVAGCGWLQLGAPHWATSVKLLQLLITEPTFWGSRFSTGRLLAIEDFTFLPSDCLTYPHSEGIAYDNFDSCQSCSSSGDNLKLLTA